MSQLSIQFTDISVPPDHHFHCSSPITLNPRTNLFFTICLFKIVHTILSQSIIHAVIPIFSRCFHAHSLSSLIFNFNDQHLFLLLLSLISFTHQFNINQHFLRWITRQSSDLDDVKPQIHFNASLNTFMDRFLTPHDQSAQNSFCFVVTKTPVSPSSGVSFLL